MRPVSDRFLRTLRGSHVACFRARVCDTYQTGTDPDGVEAPIIGGDVISSATAEVRSSLSWTTSLAWPTKASGLLAPYGNEVYVERGLAYGNGQREWVGLGYFRIDTPEQDDVPDGPITVAGQDRMAGIVGARFLAPRQFSATMTRGALVDALVKEVYPAAVIEWDDAWVRDGQVGRSVIAEDDRAGVLRELLTSLAKIGYFDHRGVFVIKNPPSTSGGPSWTVDAGLNGVLVRMARSLTRVGVYNAVVATGEAGDTTPPARGVAYNLDPNSPTFYNGRFGPVPMFFSSPFLTTNSAATAAAVTLLRKQIGLPYQVNLGAIANPALEPDDVIGVRYPKASRSRSLRTETHVLDQVTIPLTNTEPVTLQTREQQVQLIGDGS